MRRRPRGPDEPDGDERLQRQEAWVADLQRRESGRQRRRRVHLVGSSIIGAIFFFGIDCPRFCMRCERDD